MPMDLCYRDSRKLCVTVQRGASVSELKGNIVISAVRAAGEK